VSAALHFDVIVVGGGPAGSACATLLAGGGARVMVLEKAKFPRDKICGDCINPNCWELFKLLGVASEIMKNNLNKIDRVRVTNAKGVELTTAISHQPQRPFFALPRRVLDAILQKQAQRAGALVLNERQVVGVAWEETIWRVAARRKGAAEETFTGALLIGADGRNSLVARKLARKNHGVKSQQPQRVGVQWRCRYQPQIGSAIELFLFDAGYFGVVNVNEAQANIAMVADVQQAQIAKKDFSKFIAGTIMKNPGAANRFDDLQPLGELSITFPIQPAARILDHPSALLIGDARQTVEPFTGEGVYYALQDGVQAALKLLSRLRSKTIFPAPKMRSRFWANRIFSPALQHRLLAERLIAIGARLPNLTPWILRTVLD
jgi:geranylgeranyl reductase family protein